MKNSYVSVLTEVEPVESEVVVTELTELVESGWDGLGGTGGKL